MYCATKVRLEDLQNTRDTWKTVVVVVTLQLRSISTTALLAVANGDTRTHVVLFIADPQSRRGVTLFVRGHDCLLTVTYTPIHYVPKRVDRI